MASVSNSENLPPHVLRTVTKEVVSLAQEPPEGIRVHVNHDDVTDLQATIAGPEGTPYAGGQFKVKLVFGKDFPAAPPKGYFLTKIFHPNVASNGEICVNALKRDWNPQLGLRHTLLVVKCLLIEPNPESALNEEAGKLLLDDYSEFFARAKLLAEIHANAKANANSSGGGSGGTAPCCSSAATQKTSPLTQVNKAKIRKDKKKTLKRL